MQQQHANDAAEMILLHLNMNKATLRLLFQPTPHPFPHSMLDIVVLVNLILFCGGNSAYIYAYIANWIEAQISADLYSSCGLCVS